jgi:hypothetical protein
VDGEQEGMDCWTKRNSTQESEEGKLGHALMYIKPPPFGVMKREVAGQEVTGTGGTLT